MTMITHVHTQHTPATHTRTSRNSATESNSQSRERSLKWMQKLLKMAFLPAERLSVAVPPNSGLAGSGSLPAWIMITSRRRRARSEDANTERSGSPSAGSQRIIVPSTSTVRRMRFVILPLRLCFWK